MDIVLLKVSIVVPKPLDAGTTRPIFCSYHFMGRLASSLGMDFNSSVCFYQIHIDMIYHYVPHRRGGVHIVLVRILLAPALALASASASAST